MLMIWTGALLPNLAHSIPGSAVAGCSYQTIVKEIVKLFHALAISSDFLTDSLLAREETW